MDHFKLENIESNLKNIFNFEKKIQIWKIRRDIEKKFDNLGKTEFENLKMYKLRVITMDMNKIQGRKLKK